MALANLLSPDPNKPPLDPLVPGQNQSSNIQDNTPNLDPATPMQAPAYQAERVVDPGAAGTVAGQVDQITRADSPLLQAARTRASQVMNQRGTLNTSMAGQAGEQAVIETALPMAQQDAASINRRAEINQQAGNQALQLGATGNQAIEQIKASGVVQSTLQQERAIQESTLVAQRGELEKQLQTADANTKFTLVAQQGDIDRQMLGLRQIGEADLIRQRGEIDKQMQTAGLEAQAGLAAQQRELDFQINESRLSMQKILADNSNALQTSLQVLQGNQAQEIARVEAEYKTMLQASDSAVRHFMQISGDINDILIDGEIDLAAKQQLIDQEIKLLRSGLEIIGSAAGVDFNALLTYVA